MAWLVKIFINAKDGVHAYQEKGRNHEGEKLSIVPFAYTVVEPLHTPMKEEKENIRGIIEEDLIFFKQIRSCLPCSDDQSDQHIYHKLGSACCTWKPAKNYNVFFKIKYELYSRSSRGCSPYREYLQTYQNIKTPALF